MPSSVKKKSVILGVILFACVCVVIAVSSAVSSPKLRSASQLPTPRVKNNTSSVEISRVQRSGSGDVEMTLVNKSKTAIYGYTILTSSNPVQKGFTTYATVEPVEPGALKTERIPAGNFQSTAGMDPPELVFSAVYFGGGTVEGDPREAEKLSRTMRAMKQQAQLVLEILNDAIKSSAPDNDVLLEVVESKASHMTASQEASSSNEGKRGSVMVSDRFDGDIKKVRAMRKDPSISVKTKLQELTTYYGELAKKL